MRKQHVFEVTLIRSHVHPNEDLVTSRTAEQFSIKATGDISANHLAVDLSAECRDQSRDLVSSIEVHRIVDGKPESLSTREKMLENKRRFGHSRFR